MQGTVVAKATFDQEIKLFKAIVREITRHELDDNKRKWFQMEARHKLRRLAPPGVTGNQPALVAFCKTTKGEQRSITEAILQQKVGANCKTAKQYAEFRRQGDSEEQDDQMPKYNAHQVCEGGTRSSRQMEEDTQAESQTSQCKRGGKRTAHCDRGRDPIHFQKAGMHTLWAPAGDKLDAAPDSRRLSSRPLPKLR